MNTLKRYNLLSIMGVLLLFVLVSGCGASKVNNGEQALQTVKDFSLKVDEQFFGVQIQSDADESMGELYDRLTSQEDYSGPGWAVIKNPNGDGWFVSFILSRGNLDLQPIWFVDTGGTIYWVNNISGTFTRDKLDRKDVGSMKKIMKLENKLDKKLGTE
ncbi:MAG: hypothetical protein ABEJ65_04595 [bacterium]